MEKYYLAAFNFVAGCGNNRTRVLVNRFKSAENVWRASADDLLACKFLTENSVESILTLRAQGIVDNLAKACFDQDIQIINYLDEDYPKLLREIGNAPTTLFYKGKPLKSIKNPLGVVGPRKSSAYAREVVKFFIEKFADYKLSIISGGARGIDTVAHTSALEHDMHTVAVLGCGLDVTYPPENKKLFAEIAERGTLLSEYPPGVKPIAQNFPARNRIISGLSTGVLLPEAGYRSGSLITAEFALDQGREVYCVPGDIFSVNSAGVHSLIKQGAKVATLPVDILEDYFPNMDFERKEPLERKVKDEIVQTKLLETQEPSLPTHELSAEQKTVLQIMAYDEMLSMEALHMQCDLDIGTLNLVLLELEILGYINMDISQRKYWKVRGV